MIKFEKVTKKYGEDIILNKLTFYIKQGEFICVMGPSGAGKTTLINVLLGAEKLSEGSVVVDGFNVTKASQVELQSYRRKVGVIFQDYKLLPKKTVFENIAFALEVCGYEKSEIQKKVITVMQKTGLENLRNQYPKQLSGGEKQRVAIARALIHNPQILVADEPTGNLDQENSQNIINLLHKINKDGATVILATHDKDIINSIKKRVIKLSRN